MTLTPEEREMGEWGGNKHDSEAWKTTLSVLFIVFLLGGSLFLYINQGGESGFRKRAEAKANRIQGARNIELVHSYRCRSYSNSNSQSNSSSRYTDESTSERGFEFHYEDQRGHPRQVRYCCTLLGCRVGR